MERNYKNLNINRELVEPTVAQFIDDNDCALESIGDCPGSQVGIRVVFGRVGADFATLNVLFNKDGTSTLFFKTGKNQELGQALADTLFNTIDSEEFEAVNLVLNGFILKTIVPVLECCCEDEYIEMNIAGEDEYKTIWHLTSDKFQDRLTITLHKGTRRLQLQGRPLYCYKNLVFGLAELLDLKGLEKVLIRSDEGKSEIIQQEVALSHLKSVLADSYQNIHQTVEKLLVSGLCVKLAAPNLPDYSFLLYPELRSIEGILKNVMAGYNMFVEQEGFGEFFDKKGSSFEFSDEFKGHIGNQSIKLSIEKAYTFYNRERHGLFHMDGLVDSSRVIGQMSHLMTKSNSAWEHIKELYSI